METTISITGQGINSKSTLSNAIIRFNYDCQVKEVNFNNKEILFETKKEAVKALSGAFQFLKSDKEDWNASMGSYKRGASLSYDAGYAKIIKT